MVRLSGTFRLDLSLPDALVACVDAMVELGWAVETVASPRLRARTRSDQGRPSEIDIELEGSDIHGTAFRVSGVNERIHQNRIRTEMLELRDVIEAATGQSAAVPAPSGTVTLEPEFREHLQRTQVADRQTARVFRVLALALVVMGTLVIAEAVVTLLWQEPLSYVYAKRQQDDLSNQLEKVEAAYRPARAVRVKTPEQPTHAELAKRLNQSTTSGEPLGRIKIPSIDLETVFVENAGASSLQKGPAHYEDTALPGQRGTVGIAGHRTTYQAPFRDLDDLEKGDLVSLRMPYGVFRYLVEGSKIVGPDDVDVLNQVEHDRLTLTACHPLYSASERIAVFARLTADPRT